jgi:hypothetical protein
MDQRTREPLLPALTAAAETERATAAAPLSAARAVSPGQQFTVAGQTQVRPLLAREADGRTFRQPGERRHPPPPGMPHGRSVPPRQQTRNLDFSWASTDSCEPRTVTTWCLPHRSDGPLIHVKIREGRCHRRHGHGGAVHYSTCII